MKKEIHPQYYSDAKISCACGNVVKVGSTVKEMKIEVCSACHPLYTGKKKLLDTTGRVERFRKIAEKAVEKKKLTKKKKIRLKKSKSEIKKVVSKKKLKK